VDPEADRFAALLGAMTRLVRDPGVGAALAEDPGALLGGWGLAPDDARQLEALGAGRLLLYRRHVRKTLARGIQRQIPRTAARLEGAFRVWVDRWIDEESPRSRYFRHVAFEFTAWALPRWADDPAVPAYLGDLARHELVHFEVAPMPASDAPAAREELDLERGVRFDAAVRLSRYAHAVHRLDADEDARDVAAAEPVALLAYRDDAHEVRYLELTPLAAAILERLLRGDALGAAVVGGAGALGHPLDAAVTGSTAALLEDLRARGALLGGA
jgi:hypothetical protein